MAFTPRIAFIFCAERFVQNLCRTLCAKGGEGTASAETSWALYRYRRNGDSSRRGAFQLGPTLNWGIFPPVLELETSSVEGIFLGRRGKVFVKSTESN